MQVINNSLELRNKDMKIDKELAKTNPYIVLSADAIHYCRTFPEAVDKREEMIAMFGTINVIITKYQEISVTAKP